MQRGKNAGTLLQIGVRKDILSSLGIWTYSELSSFQLCAVD